MQDKVDEISMHIQQTEVQQEGRRTYSQITFRVDKVSQTHAALLDTIATSCNGQDWAGA